MVRRPKLPKHLTWIQTVQRIKPGDVIAFSGRGTLSSIIKIATKSIISHVALVLAVEKAPAKITLVEAVDIGVVESDLSEWIAYYDGEIWLLPLKYAIKRTSRALRKRADVAQALTRIARMSRFLVQAVGRPYDMSQAVKSAFDGLDFICSGLQNPRLTYNHEDFKALFCSELVAGALEAGGFLRKVNCSEVTPADLAAFRIYEKSYYQLKGKPRALRGFNAVDPTGWGS